MTGNEIRKRFLDFFAAKQHAIIQSDSVVPKDDPTVLFTTAGMQQFKRQFLGHITDYTRAASSQKCLRTDDLDQVGKTDYHLTFFEMLGNFSFGDYFKEEAIAWAWEFLTKELSIPEDRLWISVYKDDSQAEHIWLSVVKIDPKKLVKLGDKSNFWPAQAKENGPNGPCGPCSEIFYDYGINAQCTNKNCDPGCKCGRFSEIWNLVFTQFNRKEGCVLEPLPNKNIDTGMGLERLTAVVQGKRNNFQTDLFLPILRAIDRIPETKVAGLSSAEKNIMADHIRAIVFGIADGVIPSNEGRGYVIKKLIVDSADIALKTEKVEPVMYRLADSVAEAMETPYPELRGQISRIADVIYGVEAAYIRVRRDRLPELKLCIKQACNDPSKLGKIMFKFRDTYGLTIPTIFKSMDAMNIAEPIVKQAEIEFLKRMSCQQQQSRASSKMTGGVFVDTDFDLNVPKTKFMGYDHSESTSTILKLFLDNQAVNKISAGDHVKVILDRSPFYAEAGGQVGDSGTIGRPEGLILITDTQKMDDVYIHSGIVEKGTLRVNDQVRASIDLARRLAIMRNHSATHLLQSALRKILGAHVQQQGSLVAEDRLRFDFTHPRAVTQVQLRAIERYVNDCIMNCDTITKDFLPIEEARQSGALAFFAEKYGKIVRVVSIHDYSKEFCGGTHLDSTGQIGLFKITAENAIAQGIRRLEANTGTYAHDSIDQQNQIITAVCQIVKAPVSGLVERINAQTQLLKNMENELEQLQFLSIKNSIESILTKAENINGTRIISHTFKNVDLRALRKVSDLIQNKISSSVILLGSRKTGNASILLTVSQDLITKGMKANEMIKKIAPLINGSGGGKAQMAQAGSKEEEKVEPAIQRAHTIIKEIIAS